MQTLSTPPVLKKPDSLTKSDIQFLEKEQYRQDRHRLMMEDFLVVIRRYPDAQKKNLVSAFYGAVNYAFPPSSEESDASKSA
jgi:hypothetical protein